MFCISTVLPVRGGASFSVRWSLPIGAAISITRGARLYAIHCQMCHGQTAEGNGPIGPFLANKPANLTSPVVQAKSDGSIFLTITNGVEGKMPPMNENLLVPDRWDLVNFIRTLTVEEAD